MCGTKWLMMATIGLIIIYRDEIEKISTIVSNGTRKYNCDIKCFSIYVCIKSF